MNNEIKILMTEKEVERWKYFQQYYNEFVVLIDNKAFDIQFGKTELNFSNGELKVVSKHETVWKK